MGAENGVFSRAGIGNVGSYQVSGYPWMTGSALAGSNAEAHIRFPLVAKTIKVANRGGGPVRVHFAAQAEGNVYAGHHYWELPLSGSEVELSCKAEEVYISSPGAATSFDLFAELTGINTDQMPDLTGSGHTD